MFDFVAAGVVLGSGVFGVTGYALNLFQDEIKECWWQRHEARAAARQRQLELLGKIDEETTWEPDKWELKLSHRIACRSGGIVMGYVVMTAHENQRGKRKINATKPPFGHVLTTMEAWAIFQQWEAGESTERCDKALNGGRDRVPTGGSAVKKVNT